MKVSQTIAVSVSSVVFLGMMTRSTGLALAQRGGGGEVCLSAKQDGVRCGLRQGRLSRAW
jgi:hypothetical protein